MPESDDRWIRFAIDTEEQAVLESALDRLDYQEVEFYDLCNDNREFVYGGDIFELKRVLTAVSKNHRDPTAREVRLRIADIQQEQKQARGEA